MSRPGRVRFPDRAGSRREPAAARLPYSTAHCVFREGDVIEDGHPTEGLEPGPKWRCRHEEALVPPARVVLDLDPGPPHAAGKRG